MMVANQEDAWARVEYSGYSHPGFAAEYDAARPKTPTVVIETLTRMAQIPRPGLVVDLGCGTGLSTRPWGAYADRVIGIEPNPQMRQQAASHPGTPSNISYRAGFSHATGLEPGCADVVTCAQSLHWMEPEPTFAKVAQILRPGGVFAAYDYEGLPTVLHWQADAALQEFDRVARRIPPRLDSEPIPKQAKQRWDRRGHLQRMKDSGHFRYVTALSFHHQVMGSVDQLLSYCAVVDGVHRLIAAGYPEVEAARETLRKAIEQVVGKEPLPWLWRYWMWLGIR